MESIFKELRKLIGKDYDFRVEVNPFEFNVVLSTDMFEEFEITITYGVEECPYVSFEALDKYLKENNEKLEDYEYGYDQKDIKTICTVMDWMDNNKDMITKCMGYCYKNGQKE